MKKQKKRRLSLMRKRMIAGYLFILPWLVGFIIIYVRSLFQTVEFSFKTDCCRSVAQSCPTFCDPMNCSTPVLPVIHYLQ